MNVKRSRDDIYGVQPWYNPSLGGLYDYARKHGYSDQFAMIFIRQASAKHKA